MTAIQRVRRIQIQLELIVAASAIMFGAATWFLVRILCALLQLLVRLPGLVAVSIPVIAVLGAVGVAAFIAWRGRFAWSLERVALWIEERAPDLKYALVTIIDPTYATSPASAPLNAAFQRVSTDRFVWDVAKRSVPAAAITLFVAAAVFFMMPETIKKIDVSGLIDGKAAAPLGNRLEPLQARITPPAYANMRSENLDNPSTITGISGSRVVITGNGPHDGIEVTMGDKPIQVMNAPQGNRWMTAFVMPDSAMALKLVDRNYSKLIVLDARRDEAPTAKLIRPARDTTIRRPTGALTLEVALSDDIGLARTSFEYVISSGESEGNFTSRNGSVGAKTIGGAKADRYTLSVPYSHFNLKEGDIFTIQAVVYDANNISGPGKGYSESRTIRIARASEYDSISVTPAPPSADTALITLRMLIIKVKKLHSQRDTMPRPRFIDESRRHANTAEGIRRKVQQIIDETTGNGEIDPDTLLTTAMDAMWESVRSLEVAETGEAIVTLVQAYDALKKFRDAVKYYPRGLLKIPVVNVDRVRMTGEETVEATARKPLASLTDDARRQRLSSYYKDVTQAISVNDKKRAVETLTLMRVEALRGYPPLADVLGKAAQALQDNKNATKLLARARQMIDGSAVVADTLPLWSSSWR